MNTDENKHIINCKNPSVSTVCKPDGKANQSKMGRLKFSPDVLENCAILKLSKEPKNLDVKRVTRYEFYVTGKTCKRFQKQKSMNFLKLTVFDKVSECKTTATRRRLSTDLIANTDRCPSCGAHAAESVNSLWKRFCYQESFLWRFYFAVFLLTAMMVNFPSLTSAASVDSLHNSSTSSLSLPSPEMTDATSQLFNDQVTGCYYLVVETAFLLAHFPTACGATRSFLN